MSTASPTVLASAARGVADVRASWLAKWAARLAPTTTVLLPDRSLIVVLLPLIVTLI